MYRFHIHNDVKSILKQLHNHGHEAYIVGGCVRDMILGHEPYDFDITTSAEPLEVKEIFKRTIDTGLQHGTVTVLMNEMAYEVTTYRIDGTYLDNRRPESVEFTKSLVEDLKRRDFTINAMAYCEEDGVVDLYGGIDDLRAGIIRCVGVPQERFKEDALRMLRAIRFAARFGFDIDSETEAAIVQLSPLINNISAERIHMELTKTLISDNPEYMERLVTYGLIDHILPEFVPNIGMEQNNPYHAYPVDIHTYEALKQIDATEALRWSIYLHDIGKGYTKTTDEEGVDHFKGHQLVSIKLARDILNRLKFDNKTKDRVLKLVEYHDYRFEPTEKSARRALARMSKEFYEDYLKVQLADIRAQSPDKLAYREEDLELKRALFEEVISKEQCTTVKDLAIRGGDLMDLGMARGKGIGSVLQALLELVLERPELNNKETLMAEASKLIERGSDEDS